MSLHETTLPKAITARTAVCVLGMHRSGTSALTGTLRLLGVDLSEHLMPPLKDNNDRGFWEHAEIVKVHDELLEALGSDWGDPFPLPAGWWRDPVVAPYRQKLESIIRRDFDSARLWGMKDPRQCRLLPMWHGIWQQAECRPVFVLITRHPVEVALSLQNRDGLDPSLGQLLFLRYLIDAERDTRQHERIFVSYDDLLHDWRRTIDRIGGRLSIAWPRSPAQAGPQIDAFLDAGLRHYRAGDAVQTEAMASKWLERAWQAFRAAAEGDERDPSARLDVLSQELSAVEVFYTPWVRRLRSHAHRLQDSCNDAHEQLRQAYALNQQAHAANQALVQEKQELAQANQSLAGERQRLARQSQELRTHLDRLAGERSAFLEQLAWLGEQQKQLQKQVEQIRQLVVKQQWQAAEHAPPEPLHACFDSPALWTQPEGALLIAGWCCHESEAIVELKVAFNGSVAQCEYGHPRKDVAETMANCPHSAHSGFTATLPVRRGRGHLVLEAMLEDGRIARYTCPQRLVVHRHGRAARAANVARHVRNWSIDMTGAAVARFRRTGIRSTLRDLPELTKLALRQLVVPLAHGGGPAAALPKPVDPYEAWLAVNRWTDRSRQSLLKRLRDAENDAAGGGCAAFPKLSVVMPVYNAPLRFLELAIRCVVDQVYENWELCIADDASTDPKVVALLKKWAETEPRIRLVLRDENGHISRATNSAAAVATGDFLLFMDQDDAIPPDALGEIALAIAQQPDTDFIYTDSDKIDTAGSRYAPEFKPDWSPELLLSYNYLNHFCGVRRSLFEKIGGLREGFEGTQDKDLALRATELARRVTHLPLVLYHWRAVPGSTATSVTTKPQSVDAGRRTVEEAFARRGIAGEVVQPQWAAQKWLVLYEHQFPDDGPGIAVLIPSRNNLERLRRCIDSLARTTYRNYRIVIIDNESDDPETLAYLQKQPHRVLRIGCRGGFNFAAINNRAVEQIESEYVLFLNDDTEVIEPTWLSRMMGYARITAVAAVGARLFYPDGTVQHAGVLQGLYHGLAGHAFRGAPGDCLGYGFFAKVARNVSAVTAACMLTPRQRFLEMGGFDERTFGVAYNDVDYCHRLTDAGWRIVYCPGAELFHHESAARGRDGDHPRELAAFKAKYGPRIDPYYSPHLSLDDEQFRIRPRRLLRGPLPPVRTAVFSNQLSLTGGPMIQSEIVLHLKSRGVIDPVVYSIEDGPLRQLYERHGINVRIVDPHPLTRVVSQLERYDDAIERLAELVRRDEPQLVYANTILMFAAISVAERLGLPSVWNIHESEGWERSFETLGQHVAARAVQTFHLPYRVIFGSEATRSVYGRLNTHHNFTVLRNPLGPGRLEQEPSPAARAAARRDLGLAEDEVALLLLGTVCERKGQLDLPRALAKLPPRLHGRVRCFIVGDRSGPYSAELRAAVAELSPELVRRVSIVPETPEVERFYLAADVFVCTSRRECFPRVLLEAMRYRLPIVTTPVFGIREQVREGVNGLYYEPGDADGLLREMVSLVDDAARRAVMAENAAWMLRQFDDFETTAEKYAEIFREAYAAAATIA